MADIITQPIKFLGATVISFNTSLGLGSAQESTLNVDLVEDCENGDIFQPATGAVEVGSPVYFTTGVDGFSFGGVLTNWTVSSGSSGKVYNVKVTDPRQLLENTMVVVDSYMGPPAQTTNYFNVYSSSEGSVFGGNCAAFGSSGSNGQGMPYSKVIQELQNMNPTICSTTGYNYTIDFSSFPQSVPAYYRVPGPGVSVLQLLQDVCDVLGLEFYANLLSGGLITIGLIDLSAPPSSFSTIIDAYGPNGGPDKATDINYGQELRNEKSRMLVFGEKQHYMSMVNKFNFFFGEEWNGSDYEPIIPYKYTENYGFWIKKRVKDLNLSLKNPLGGNGPYDISEKDIKAAMTSFQLWFDRVADPDIKGSFNKAIRDNFNMQDDTLKRILEMMQNDPNLPVDRLWQAWCDANNTPGFQEANAKPPFIMDMEQIHSWVQNLGETYYGKQFFCELNQNVCYYYGENYQEKIFSHQPTNAGGWVDEGTPVLGLTDPDLTLFRENDNRISTFAVFAIDDDQINQTIDEEPDAGTDDPGMDDSGNSTYNSTELPE